METMEMLVLLSGPIAVGKTSVRQELLAAHGFEHVRSSAYLKELAQTEGRTSLQDLGDRLDEETDYRWLLDSVARPGFMALPGQQRWLVDAVRKKRQVEHFRDAYGPLVLHVHLTAPEEILKQRYASRLSTSGDQPEYAIAIEHENETASRRLIDIADLVLDANLLTPQGLAQLIVNTGQKRGWEGQDSAGADNYQRR